PRDEDAGARREAPPQARRRGSRAAPGVRPPQAALPGAGRRELRRHADRRIAPRLRRRDLVLRARVERRYLRPGCRPHARREGPERSGSGGEGQHGLRLRRLDPAPRRPVPRRLREPPPGFPPLRLMSDIAKKIAGFITDNLLLGRPVDISGTSSFLEAGIIDSTGVLELVQFLEETWGFSVHDQEMVPENLDSLKSLEAFVS